MFFFNYFITKVNFSISGVETYLWLPPLFACIISFFTSIGGISGAFLLVPFQLDFLHFTSPAVTSTNLIFNIVAVPSAIWRCLKEKRIIGFLTWILLLGSLPGIIIGCYIRLYWLFYPEFFKGFVGCVLFYISLKLFIDFKKKYNGNNSNFIKLQSLEIEILNFNYRFFKYQFQGIDYNISILGIFFIAFIVGILGGVYGIGGGAIIVPFLIAVYKLPIYTIVGAAFVNTYISSVVGVIFYQLLSFLPEYKELAVSPDWLLGGLFGLGGVIGMYFGVYVQRYILVRWIKLGLALMQLYIAIYYLLNFIYYLY